MATQYAPAPACLNIISCKYENRQRLQFTTEFAKRQTSITRKNKHCAILPSLCRHCQSKAKHSRIWAQAIPFWPSNKLMPSPPQVDLWPFDLESGVRVTCEVGYLCANFSLPRPLCSRLRPDVRDRYTSDVRRASSLNASALWGQGHNNRISENSEARSEKSNRCTQLGFLFTFSVSVPKSAFIVLFSDSQLWTRDVRIPKFSVPGSGRKIRSDTLYWIRCQCACAMCTGNTRKPVHWWRHGVYSALGN